MKDKVLIKYNEDDILELLTEFLAKEREFEEFNTKAILLGSPGKDLRLVAVVGDPEDNSIIGIDLNEIDKTIDFNGSHSFVKYIDPSTFVKKEINDC